MFNRKMAFQEQHVVLVLFKKRQRPLDVWCAHIASKTVPCPVSTSFSSLQNIIASTSCFAPEVAKMDILNRETVTGWFNVVLVLSEQSIQESDVWCAEFYPGYRNVLWVRLSLDLEM
jgi:hypothetical protein